MLIKLSRWSHVSRSNAGQSHNIKIDNSSFEMMEQFKYLGTTLMNQNCILEEIKKRLESGNAAIIQCRIFCQPFVIQNIKIKIYRTIILPVCFVWV